MLYVNDAFSNGVYIEEGSLYYDPIYKAYCDRGYMPAQQIFEAFVPHKYFTALKFITLLYAFLFNIMEGYNRYPLVY